MNSLIQNQVNAFSIGARAYKNALSNSSGGPRSNSFTTSQSERFGQYQILWDGYQNALYLKENGYAFYLTKNNLYSKTRQVYSYIEDAVDFFADRVYGGTINDQGAVGLSSTGLPIVGDEAQQSAINQILQWSNFATVSRQFVTFGAATGDSFLVVSDDREGGRVSIQVRKPWHVKEINRDDRGNIIHSVEEFPVSNSTESYLYRREMSPDEIKVYKDDEMVSHVVNDYGFVPMSYVQHRFNVGAAGKPAFRNWRALDEVNSLGSRLNDYIRDQADVPTLFVGMGNVTQMTVQGANQTDGRAAKMLCTDADGRKEDLSGNLDLGAAEVRISNLLSELERSNPEVTTFKKLREMGSISGVAVQRMLGDIEARLSGPQQNYDAGLIISLRQALAIAGMRQSEGLEGWAKNTAQQLNLSPFDLDSYHAGDLNFAIAPRPLVSLDSTERLLLLKSDKEIEQINSQTT